MRASVVRLLQESLVEEGFFPGEVDANPNGWPHQAEAELIRRYGKKGENQTKLALPYPIDCLGI